MSARQARRQTARPAARRAKPCIAVIGGAGAMGRITIRDLVETAPAGVDIVLADRNAAVARDVVRALPAARRRRVRVAVVDASNVDRTARSLAGTSVLINACHHTFNLRVMHVALACGAHYCDLGGLFHVTRQQLRLHRRFARAGLLALCGMGSAPGIVNIMAHAAAEPLDTVEEIHIAVGTVAGAQTARDETASQLRAAQAADGAARAAGRAGAGSRAVRGSAATDAGGPPAASMSNGAEPPLATSYSIDTILDEASQPAALFTNGELTFVEPLSGADAVDFPPPVGRQYPARTLHSELATLPHSFADRGVREVSFRIAFAGDLMERLRFLHRLGLTGRAPVRAGGVRVAPRDVLLALLARQQLSAPAPASSANGAAALDEYEVLRVTVRGHEGGRAVEVVSDCHVAGIADWGLGVDVDTGCPPSIVAQMILRGDIGARGVLPPERAVPPEPFFSELAQRGMRLCSSKLSDVDAATESAPHARTSPRRRPRAARGER